MAEEIGARISIFPWARFDSKASTFRLACDSQHNFSARVMGRGLLLRLYRISQRKNFRHDWFEFPRIDQLSDLSEIVGIGMNRDTRAANSMFLKLGRIRSRDQ